MKAVVFFGVGDIRYEADWAPARGLRSGEVRLATSWCGICGTDMEDYRYGVAIPTKAPHPESGRMAPLVLGHEFSGRIVELADDVRALEIGQRVAVECVRPCRHCYWCGRGEYAACENMVSIGQMDDGGMADQVVVPAVNCLSYGDSLGEDEAALAEPLAVMFRAIERGRLQPGDKVALVGAGPIGLCGVIAARVAGASGIYAVERGGRRAEVALELGADRVFDSALPNWRREFEELTQGRGADLVLDCGGSPASMRLAFELTRRGGRCVIVSVVNADIAIPGMEMLRKEKEIIGSCGHSYDREFLRAVRCLSSGKVNVKPMISERIYISDAVEKGFKRLFVDRSPVKILVTPRLELLRTGESMVSP